MSAAPVRNVRLVSIRVRFGDLMINQLLAVEERPTGRDIAKRACDAASDFLQLRPLPAGKSGRGR